MILRLATHAMATRFEFVLVGEDERRLRAAGEEAIAIVQEWHARLNRFAPDSELSFLNRTARRRPVRIDGDWMELLRLCRRVHALSGGAFDPAACAGDTAGLSAVQLDDATSTVWFSEPVTLDLGGIAKGFALDRVEGALRAAGVDRALVHGGTSSVLALGAPTDSGAWPVEVRASAGAALRIPLRGHHLSVSSPAGNSGGGDHRRGHIVDPRGGEAPPLARTVAVTGPTGAEAEAWSTALAVLGSRPPEMPVAYTSAVHTPAAGWLIAGADARQLEIRTTHLSESA